MNDLTELMISLRLDKEIGNILSELVIVVYFLFVKMEDKFLWDGSIHQRKVEFLSEMVGIKVAAWLKIRITIISC